MNPFLQITKDPLSIKHVYPILSDLQDKLAIQSYTKTFDYFLFNFSENAIDDY